MEEFRLCNSDYRFLTIVWDHAPVGSGELVRLCQEQLGWKKSKIGRASWRERV